MNKFDGNNVISSLPEISNDFCLLKHKMNDDYNVEIKQDHCCRNAIIDFLRKNGIHGWLTSLENTDFIEVCLFTKNTNAYSVKPIERCEIDNSLNYFRPFLKLGTCVALTNHNKILFENLLDSDESKIKCDLLSSKVNMAKLLSCNAWERNSQHNLPPCGQGNGYLN